MKWLVAVMALAGCRDALAVDQPIDVVPLGSWTAQQNADLEHAAECWNLGFGTTYRFRVTSDVQRAQVAFDELQCLNTSDWALTTAGFDARVSVCLHNIALASTSAAEHDALFGVFTHELGHVAGIIDDVDDTSSIMGGIEPLFVAERIGESIFSTEDHALFAEYNADFTGRGTCDPIVVAAPPSFSADSLQCACP
jgi:hypothetical protein